MGETGRLLAFIGGLRMRVRCGNGEGAHWHDISPTGLVVVLEAIREGELITIGTSGVSLECYTKAFTVTRVGAIRVRYDRKNIISIDGREYAIRAPKNKAVGGP